MNTDVGLGEGTPSDAAEDAGLGEDIVDATPGLDAEDFDFDEFVAGVRPGRKQVKVYMRADLAAELDAILMRAESLDENLTPEQVEEANAVLLEEFEDIKRQINASARVFVVEARSEHRMRQIIKRLEKTGVTRPGKKATDDELAEWQNEVALHRLADAIMVPSNVTVEGLRMLERVAESEMQKLYGAFHQANTNPTRAVTPNFSLRR